MKFCGPRGECVTCARSVQYGGSWAALDSGYQSRKQILEMTSHVVVFHYEGRSFLSPQIIGTELKNSNSPLEAQL